MSDDNSRRKPQIKWTDDRVEFLRTHYPTNTCRALTALFNEAFNVEVTEGAVGQQLHAHNITKRAGKAF